MGRVAVREAVASYLEQAGLPYVGTVYPSRTYIDEPDYGAIFGGLEIDNSGCVIMVNLPTDQRVRQTDAGRAFVDDRNVHDVVLELFFTHIGGAVPATATRDPVLAQQDYDTMVDALVTAIRNDPSLGNPSVIWSAGEFAYGVKHSQTSPRTNDDGLTIFIDGVIRFQAWEWVAQSA